MHMQEGSSSKRRRRRGNLSAWMIGCRHRGVTIPTLLIRWTFFSFLFAACLMYLLSPQSLPSSYLRNPNVGRGCSSKEPPLPFLDSSSYCTGECNSECFPRVQNICFASDKVRICENLGIKGLRRTNDVPKFMRFWGEELTVPVVYDSSCSTGWHWMSGFGLVLDQRFLPRGKPNPHHEAEKILPAMFFKQLNGSATIHWFAAEKDVSIWGRGLLQALEQKVRYQELPTRADDSICFYDAVLFSGPTSVKYVPDVETNAELRSKVLKYCGIEPANASWPVRKAVVLDRASGPRRLANKLDVGDVISEVLMVPVEHRASGLGSFCDQVKSVAEDDFFIVPHGSQNVNFLFARPGAVVIEVFPYLFHTDAFQNFTHATAIELQPLLGIRPPDNILMGVYSFLGWDACYNHVRWCKNYSRKQAIHVDLIELAKLVRSIQVQRSAFRTDLVG